MVGYSAMIVGGQVFAYGISRLSGAYNKSLHTDLIGILVPPTAALANIDLKD